MTGGAEWGCWATREAVGQKWGMCSVETHHDRWRLLVLARIGGEYRLVGEAHACLSAHRLRELSGSGRLLGRLLDEDPRLAALGHEGGEILAAYHRDGGRRVGGRGLVGLRRRVRFEEPPKCLNLELSFILERRLRLVREHEEAWEGVHAESSASGGCLALLADPKGHTAAQTHRERLEHRRRLRLFCDCQQEVVTHTGRMGGVCDGCDEYPWRYIGNREVMTGVCVTDGGWEMGGGRWGKDVGVMRLCL